MRRIENDDVELGARTTCEAALPWLTANAEIIDTPRQIAERLAAE